MKILLLGKNGQLGWELQRSLAVLGGVVAPAENSTQNCSDLTNPEWVAQVESGAYRDWVDTQYRAS